MPALPLNFLYMNQTQLLFSLLFLIKKHLLES